MTPALIIFLRGEREREQGGKITLHSSEMGSYRIKIMRNGSEIRIRKKRVKIITIKVEKGPFSRREGILELLHDMCKMR